MYSQESFALEGKGHQSNRVYPGQLQLSRSQCPGQGRHYVQFSQTTFLTPLMWPSCASASYLIEASSRDFDQDLLDLLVLCI